MTELPGSADPWPVRSNVQETDSDLDSTYISSESSESEGSSTQCLRPTSRRTRQREPDYRQGSAQKIARSLNPQSSGAIYHGEAVVTNSGGIRPWVLLFIFSIVQLFLSSTMSSNGVNASSPDQSTDAGTSSTRDGGGSGNSAPTGGRNYNRQYFRTLPPIIDPSRAQGTIVTEQMTESRRLTLRKEAKDMFLHGYHGYLNHAFPKDELNPVACNGRGPDRYNPNNININDVLGDFSLTLIDALDTLAVMKEPELFRQAIQLVTKHVRDFDINSRVQVFEVNIRVLGALLSGHLYASDPAFKSLVKGYNGELLTMAKDLGKRLMKAFENTPTGIPWPRVNLRKGVLPEESSEQCVAGAGSLLLEFGVLSRLTGDKSYEEAARRALFELWNRRSKIGLMGNTINITTGQWMSAMTGIGAGTDSFYEYLLKSYILFGNKEYYEMYETSQESIRRNLLHDSRYFYKHVHLEDGSLLAQWVDSLSAFMPGVQVLGGDLESAIKNHLYYYNIWRKYQAIPERFDFVQQGVAIANYPLRPEFIESNYFLYRATKDPFYLQVGEMVLRDLQKYTKTKCGWASLQSVVSKKHEDRMESFALSETIKYLYLLFDEENLLHQELKDSNFVFTTEGHVLNLPSKYLHKDSAPSSHRPPNGEHQHSRPKEYNSQSLAQAVQDSHPQQEVAPAGPICRPHITPATFLKSIPYRPDADFARQMVGTREDIRDRLQLDPKGFCEKPTLEVERVVVEFSGPPKKTFFEDDEDDQPTTTLSSATSKDNQQPNRGGKLSNEVMVVPVKKGVYVNKIVGVKMLIQYDDLLNGYRAIKVEDHPLSLNCNVYIEQNSMQPLWDSYQRAQEAHLRVFRTNPSSSSSPSSSARVVEKDLLITPADFGYWRPRILEFGQKPDPYSQDQVQIPETSMEDHLEQAISQHWQQPMMVPASTRTKPITTKGLIRVHDNPQGCRPYTMEQAQQIRDRMVVVDRGSCLFILKAYYAQAAGAHTIVVINTADRTFTMTGSARVDHGMGEGIHDDDIDIHVVMISRSDGQVLLDWIKEDERRSSTPSSSPSSTEIAEEEVPRLAAGIVQRKLTKEEKANARLSYNSLPIVNVYSVAVPMSTFG